MFLFNSIKKKMMEKNWFTWNHFDYVFPVCFSMLSLLLHTCCSKLIFVNIIPEQFLSRCVCCHHNFIVISYIFDRIATAITKMKDWKVITRTPIDGVQSNSNRFYFFQYNGFQFDRSSSFQPIWMPIEPIHIVIFFVCSFWIIFTADDTHLHTLHSSQISNKSVHFIRIVRESSIVHL